MRYVQFSLNSTIHLADLRKFENAVTETVECKNFFLAT